MKEDEKVKVEYDFTSETSAYCLDLLNKYMNKDIKSFEKYVIYRKLKCMDPDDKSCLLQKIYEDKWDDKYLNKCRKDKKSVCSDTMTSVQGLLNSYYMSLVKTNSKIEEEWNDKYKKDNNLGNWTKFSEKAMFFMFNNIKEYPEFEKEIINKKEIIEFIRKYHTIGNYIPVPIGFNRARSGKNNSMHDMWDLTLTKIYYYYEEAKDEEDAYQSLKDLLHLKIINKENKYIIDNTKEWLNSFKSWKLFISENYLQDYVDIEKKSWPIKEEFKNMHDWKHTFPKDPINYFELVTSAIISRGNNILLGNKIEI